MCPIRRKCLGDGTRADGRRGHRILPTNFSSEQRFYEAACKEFTEKRNGCKVDWRKYCNYKCACVFPCVCSVVCKAVKLDPNQARKLPMVANLPDSCVVLLVQPCSEVADCPECGQAASFSRDKCCGKLTFGVPAARLAPAKPVQRVTLPRCATYSWTDRPCSAPMPCECKRCCAEQTEMLSRSGWYYMNLDWQGAQTLLKDTSPGVFIIRDSGDKNFKYSLSVQTERGPTSVRLHYTCGFFSLDCEKNLSRYMPRFRYVIDLVLHYTNKHSSKTVWVDRYGCPHSPVLLKTPMRQSPPTLLHAARLAIHKALDSNPNAPKLKSAPKYRLLPLPPRLLDYLDQYPYSI